MRTIAAMAGLAAAATIFLCAGSSLAQGLQTTLPEVDVTAQKPLPPKAYTPMLGKVRVEEDKWPEIPCAGAHIHAGAAGKCQDGPMVMSAMSYMVGANVPLSYGHCTVRHQLISTDIGPVAVEADVMVFDPYLVSADPYNVMCSVASGFTNLPDDFRDMNQVARRGVDWRNFIKGSGQAGSESRIDFADGRRGCVALERIGPAWHGGFVWVLHATLCQAAPTPIAAPEINAVVGNLRIAVYDPVGNLVPPPRE